MKRLLLLAMTGIFSSLISEAAPPEYRSPEVTERGSVIFRYYAPAAKAVQVQGLRNRPPQLMVKNAAGIWELEVNDLPSDIYGYSFDVEGAVALDPRNREFKRWINTENALFLDRGDHPLWAEAAVPHGVVHRHHYSSAISGREESVLIYTPPGYMGGGKPWPVVVLCHGFGDDEGAWIENGRANFIADNLIAAGKATPAVIVMAYGHPVSITGPTAEYFENNLVAMEKRVLEEVLPLVETNYTVRKDAKGRAITGLSMGGGHTLGIGLKHPEIFQYVGAMSAAIPGGDWSLRYRAIGPGSGESRVKVLWIAIGREDFLIPGNTTFQSWLKDQKVPHEYLLTEGGHEWTLWRDYLGRFLQLTFK